MLLAGNAVRAFGKLVVPLPRSRLFRRAATAGQTGECYPFRGQPQAVKHRAAAFALNQIWRGRRAKVARKQALELGFALLEVLFAHAVAKAPEGGIRRRIQRPPYAPK